MTDEEMMSVVAVEHCLPRILSGRWERRASLPGQVSFVNRVERLSVILSAARRGDGKMWVHFSMAHRDRIPTWDELVRTKESILGRESKAVMVLAPRSQWVNIHPFVLHLFMSLDHDPLPDFTDGSGSL